jgi:putative transposase
VSVFPFIEADKAEQRNVAKACCLLEVSRSAFYEWHKHVPSARRLADDELAQRIQAIWDDSKGTYGWPRVHRQLRRDGVHVSRKRVARIMRQKGLIGRCRRRWTRTTISDPGVVAVDWSRPRMPRRPPQLHPRWTPRRRSPPRTEPDPRAARSRADPATASSPASHGLPVGAGACWSCRTTSI